MSKVKGSGARTTWLENYSKFLSNGFQRLRVWERDGLIFKTNKEAEKYMEKLSNKED